MIDSGVTDVFVHERLADDLPGALCLSTTMRDPLRWLLTSTHKASTKRPTVWSFTGSGSSDVAHLWEKSENRVKRARVAIAGMSVLVLVLAACGGEEEPAANEDGDAGEAAEEVEEVAPDDDEAPDELITGPGITDDTIFIGEITAATGPAAVFGDAITNGQVAYFSRVNEEGGVAGRQVEFMIRDSQYDVQRTVEAYTEIADQVAVMGQIIGTPHTNAVLDNIKRDQLLTAPTTAALSLAFEPEIIMVTSPYAVDMANVAEYGVEELGLGDATWGAIAPDDDFGEDHFEGVRKAVEVYDLDFTEEVTFRPTDQDFTAQVQRLADQDVDVVLVGAIGGATPRLLGAAQQIGFEPTWLASNPTWVTAFEQVPEAHTLFVESDYYMASPFAVWGEDLPGMDEMIADLEAYTPDQPPEIYFIMGYTQARVIHAILEQAFANNDVSREGLLEAFGGVDEVPQGGLLPDLNYGATATERIPTRETRIFAFDDTVEGFLVPLTEYEASEAATRVTELD